MYRKLIKGWCKLELASVYCVVFPQPLCGGWGAYEFGPRNTSG